MRAKPLLLEIQFLLKRKTMKNQTFYVDGDLDDLDRAGGRTLGRIRHEHLEETDDQNEKVEQIRARVPGKHTVFF